MTAVEAGLESKNWDLCRQTDNQISTLSAPSSTCVLQMTRQGKGSSPDWVRGGLGKAGWSPVSENANPAAAQPAQVLHRQPSYPYHENQTSETWGYSQEPSRWDGTWQKYHSGGAVPGCIWPRTPSPALSRTCYMVPVPLTVLLL